LTPPGFPEITDGSTYIRDDYEEDSQDHYNRPLQQQQNPYGAALPQPPNSQSVDLSSIRPVHSGTVSIADAIARARVIATKKGISYERPKVRGVSPERAPPHSGRHLSYIEAKKSRDYANLEPAGLEDEMKA
jgi:hypothetical protein